MNYFDLIEARESCRAYSTAPVTHDEIITCIAAARLAPSACNSQPVRYIVVEKEADKKAMCIDLKEHGFNKFVDNCTAFIVILETPAILFSPKEEVKTTLDQTFAQIDVGLATMQFCLAATEIGLNTCIMGGFSPEKIAKFLGVKENEGIPRLVIAIGHSANDEHRKKQRNAVEDLVKFF